MPDGVRIEIESLGEVIVNRQLVRFRNNLADPRPGLQAAAVVLRESTERQFATEGGNSGGWQPLAASTVAHKARHGLHPQILRATDALRLSLIRKFDPAHIERASAESLVFGTSVSYARFHQSSRPRHRLPFRPMIAPTEMDKRQMVREVQKALLDGVKV